MSQFFFLAIHQDAEVVTSISEVSFLHMIPDSFIIDESLSKHAQIGLNLEVLLNIDLLLLEIDIAQLGRKLQLKSINEVITNPLVTFNFAEAVDLIFLIGLNGSLSKLEMKFFGKFLLRW